MALNESDINFLRSELTKYVSGKRLSHSYAVEEEATALGQLFGICGNDLLRLRVAAVLHDITKEKKPDQQIELCKKHGIEISDDDVSSPKVFHSVTGAYEARELYPDYVDKEIFDAIRYHTTGRPDMTLFDKLIYLADYIEKTRDFPDCIELRKYFYSKAPTVKHLNETILLSFDMTVRNLIDDGASIHKATVNARNAIIKEIKKC